MLIVDDSPLARMIVRRTLQSAGVEAEDYLEAEDGEAALATLRARRVDLVIADLNMPRLDGEGLLTAMRGDTTLQAVPVIVCSSLASDAREARLRANGVYAVLRKPISPAVLGSAVRGLGRGAP